MESEKTNDLLLIKEMSGKLTQYQYFCRVSSSEILIIDSKGDIFLMNSNLEIRRFKIEFGIEKKIVSIRLWKNYLLYLKNY